MYHEFMPIFLISNLVIHTDVSKFKYGIAVFLHLISLIFIFVFPFPNTENLGSKDYVCALY